MVFLKEIFENIDYEKKSSDNKNACKLTQHARVKYMAELLKSANFTWSCQTCIIVVYHMTSRLGVK